MKRSAQVGLLLMGAGTVGVGAYAMMPHRDCNTGQPAAQISPQQSNECSTRSSSSHGSGGGGRSWSSHSSSSSGGDSGSSGSHGSSTVAHGGFGSTGHGFSSGS